MDDMGAEQERRSVRSGFVEIQGREYELVANRLARFRAEHADWSIKTEIVDLTDVHVVVRAEIWNADRVMATGHARELFSQGPINRTSGLENAETSALGRALALLGYAGGADIASAEEMRQQAFQTKVLEREVDDYFHRIVDAVRAEDVFGYVELWRELSRDAQIAMWGKFNSKQKAWMRAAEQEVAVAEKQDQEEVKS